MSEASEALVVIVHFGAVAPTLELANATAGFSGASVVVVANDGIPPPTDLAPGVTWVPSANTGYFGALRTGLQRLTTQAYVVLLNNDIELSELAFRHCVEVLRADPGLGVVGPVLNYPDGRRQSGSGNVIGLTRDAHTGGDPGARLTPCTWITGAVMFISRAAIEQVGYDAGYFLGAEDLDLCLRMSGGGYGVACDGRVAAVHQHSAEIGTLWNYYAPRNTLWFARKHYSALRRILIVLKLVVVCARVFAADLSRRRGLVATVMYLAGLRDGLLPTAATEDHADPREPIAVDVARRWAALTQRGGHRPSR